MMRQPYYEDSHVTLYHGDCLEVMEAIKGVDLVFTSPPYNLLNSTGNGMKDGRGSKWEKSVLRQGYEVHDDNMPHQQYVEWQKQCLAGMWNSLSENGAIFYNHKWRVQNGLLQDRADIVSSFPVRQIIIWQRKGGINFNSSYFLPTYEVIYMIAKPHFRLAPKTNAYGDIWSIPQDRGNPHPASFPIALAERAISATTGNLILDPFAGSGTTLLAAKQLQKKVIGIEKSEQYCELAATRISSQLI